MNAPVITPEIMDEIRNLARSAKSKEDLVRAIHHVITQFDIDPSHIPLESWKQLLVVAFSASPIMVPGMGCPAAH